MGEQSIDALSITFRAALLPWPERCCRSCCRFLVKLFLVDQQVDAGADFTSRCLLPGEILFASGLLGNTADLRPLADAHEYMALKHEA